MTMTLRDTSAAFGSAAMRLSAGTISVLPLPPISLIVRSAWLMLAALAGTECGDSMRLLPENSITLKVSLGRRLPMRCCRSTLAVSSG